MPGASALSTEASMVFPMAAMLLRLRVYLDADSLTLSQTKGDELTKMFLIGAKISPNPIGPIE